MTGYFQGYKFFKNHLNELKKVLTFNKDIIDNIKDEYKDLIFKNKTIGVHIRHGDMYKMLKNSEGYVKFPILRKSYYIDAFKKIKNISEYNILFFTDTASKWIKEHLLLLHNKSYLIKDNSTDEDLYLMSQCDYLICSNSTLSYWGGILGKKKVVIAPKYLMNIGGKNELKFDNKEYYPPNWIILNNMKTSIWKLDESDINYVN